MRDHNAPPAGRNLYPLRSRITCAQCQRRMSGLTASDTRVYYVCPRNPNNLRHAAKHPDHIRGSFRDHEIYRGSPQTVEYPVVVIVARAGCP